MPAEEEVSPKMFEPDMAHSEHGALAVMDVRGTADAITLPDPGESAAFRPMRELKLPGY